MDPWSRWLFQDHTEAELRAWARRLSVFRYVRAHGGHANDGDRLAAAFRYRTHDALEAVLASMGIPLHTYTEPPPQPEAGTSYRSEAFAAFPSLIAGTLTEQPSWQSINGQRVHLWCHAGLAHLSISGSCEVNEACVQAAEKVESALVGLAAAWVDPPVDSHHCLCPKYYPAYFG